MSELVVHNRQHMNDLMQWAQAAHEVHTVAKMICNTEFVPGAMRGRPDAVSAAILTSRELGLMPMVGLAAIDVIDGKPALNALALRGLLLSHGHHFQTMEKSDTRVVIRARRDNSEHWEESVWTITRAEKAGLAGKRNWRLNPQAMLVARATSEVCRLVAADAIIGLAYSQEELRDGMDADGFPVPDPDPVPGRVKRIVQRAPAPPAPPLEPPGRQHEIEAPRPVLVPVPDPETKPDPQPVSPPRQPPPPRPPAPPTTVAEPPSRSQPQSATHTGTEVDDWPEVAIPGDPGGVDDPDAEKPATQEQRNILHHALGQLGKIQDKVKFVREITGNHTIKNSAGMTREEAKRCIERAQKLIAEREVTGDAS
jgi:hypothetical protein